eukprot:149105-Rhodomonas_salina.2
MSRSTRNFRVDIIISISVVLVSARLPEYFSGAMRLRGVQVETGQETQARMWKSGLAASPGPGSRSS